MSSESIKMNSESREPMAATQLKERERERERECASLQLMHKDETLSLRRRHIG